MLRLGALDGICLLPTVHVARRREWIMKMRCILVLAMRMIPNRAESLTRGSGYAAWQLEKLQQETRRLDAPAVTAYASQLYLAKRFSSLPPDVRVDPASWRRLTVPV